MTSMMDIMVSQGIFPASINLAVVKPVLKNRKLDKTSAASYRPISLGETFANIYESLLLRRINRQYPDINEQFGFKRNSSCAHAIFTLKETISRNANSRKTLFVTAIDASKAFDRLVREALFVKLQDKIDFGMWRSLRTYYGPDKAVIRSGEVIMAMALSEARTPCNSPCASAGAARLASA